MTWDYSGNPADSDKDTVRFLIGDTDTDDQLISDEEISFALAQISNVYQAGALILRTLVSKYARLADSSIDSVKVSYSQKSTQFKEAAAILEDQAQRSSADSLGIPVLGGINQAIVEGVNEDTSRVAPQFSMDLFKNKNRQNDIRSNQP